MHDERNNNLYAGKDSLNFQFRIKHRGLWILHGFYHYSVAHVSPLSLCVGASFTQYKLQCIPVYAGLISQSVSVHSNADWYFLRKKKAKAWDRERQLKKEREEKCV